MCACYNSAGKGGRASAKGRVRRLLLFPRGRLHADGKLASAHRYITDSALSSPDAKTATLKKQIPSPVSTRSVLCRVISTNWRAVMSAKASAVLRIAAAVSIVAWLMHQAGLKGVVDHLSQARPAYLLAAFGMLAVDTFLRAGNWGQLVRGLLPGASVRFGGLLYCNLASGFIGSVLPSSLGTDAVRAMLGLRLFGGRLASFAASVVTLNLLSMTCNAAFGVLGLLILLPHSPLVASVYWSFLLIFVGIVSAAGIIYALLRYRRAWPIYFMRRMPPRTFKLRRALRHFVDALLVIDRAHVRAIPIIAVALMAALTYAMHVSLVALSVGVALPITVWLIVLPLRALVGLLPLSVSGFGAGQAAIVFLLVPFGVAADQAFVVSTLLAILGLLFNVIAGSIAFLMGPYFGLDRSAVLASGTESPKTVSSTDS